MNGCRTVRVPFVVTENTVLAALPLATGHAAEATAALRESLALFERENRAREALEARTLLAEALLEEGKAADARLELDRAAPQAKASQKVAARLDFAIVSARVEGSANAARTLDAVVAEAARHGLAAYQLRARLAQGEIEFHLGNRSAARLLHELEQDARERGFEAIARQAAALHQ